MNVNMWRYKEGLVVRAAMTGEPFYVSWDAWNNLTNTVDLSFVTKAKPTVKITNELYKKLVKQRIKKPEKLSPVNSTTGENVCDNCSGQGFIAQFAHINNGVCFKCGGSGKAH